jgi:hypothetical protein
VPWLHAEKTSKSPSEAQGDHQTFYGLVSAILPSFPEIQAIVARKTERSKAPCLAASLPGCARGLGPAWCWVARSVKVARRGQSGEWADCQGGRVVLICPAETFIPEHVRNKRKLGRCVDQPTANSMDGHALEFKAMRWRCDHHKRVLLVRHG